MVDGSFEALLSLNVMEHDTIPIVSVCIQTYQHASFIAEALDSVLCQETVFNFEIILGEDESTDGTREICQEYAARFPDKIRLFLRSRKDVIRIDGRPTGRFNLIENLAACRGEFVAFLEGDDYWEGTQKLQAQVDFLRNNPRFGGMTSRVRVVDEAGRAYGTILPTPEKSIVFGLSDFFADLRTVSTCALIVRRSLIPQPFPAWFYKVLSADLSLSYFVMREGQYIMMESSIRAAYRRHGGGIWTKLNSAERYRTGVRYWEIFKASEETIPLTMRFVNFLALTRKRLGVRRESSRLPVRFFAASGFKLIDLALRLRFWLARNFRSARLLR